jgi:periplasmic divalent cation tolerance protein
MTGISTVYVTFPNDEEARRIGRLMVEEKLAACVNILGACHSIYRWEGKIEDADEVAALFKTRAATAPQLITRIAELHSYDLPAAVSWPIADFWEPYAEWVIEQS